MSFCSSRLELVAIDCKVFIPICIYAFRQKCRILQLFCSVISKAVTFRLLLALLECILYVKPKTLRAVMCFFWGHMSVTGLAWLSRSASLTVSILFSRLLFWAKQMTMKRPSVHCQQQSPSRLALVGHRQSRDCSANFQTAAFADYTVHTPLAAHI